MEEEWVIKESLLLLLLLQYPATPLRYRRAGGIYHRGSSLPGVLGFCSRVAACKDIDRLPVEATRLIGSGKMGEQ